jgi:hypothetical protein
VGKEEGFLVLGASDGDSVGLGVINAGAGVGFVGIRGTFVLSLVTTTDGEGVSVVTVLSHSSCNATSWDVVIVQPSSWTNPYIAPLQTPIATLTHSSSYVIAPAPNELAEDEQ